MPVPIMFEITSAVALPIPSWRRRLAVGAHALPSACSVTQGRRTRYSGVAVADSRWTLTKRRRTSLRIPACTALFDKTGGAGDHLMTQTRALRAAARGLAPEVQVHQYAEGE